MPRPPRGGRRWCSESQKPQAESRLLAAVLALSVAAACGGGPRRVVLKLGHAMEPTHPVHLAMEHMARRFAEKSGGRARVDIYASSTLGTERETLELLQIGGLGMTKVSTAILEQFAPAFRVFGLPYLFRDEAHRFAVMDGPVGRRLLLTTERVWLRGLTYYDAGTRSFYSRSTPILRPEDLSGLKVRTQHSAVAIRTIAALGGSPTPMGVGELYTALQQGVVDAAENNPPSYHTSRHYEVAPYFSLDEHTAVPDVLLISTAVWDGLDGDERRWLAEAAEESAQVQRRLWREATARALEAVQRGGAKVFHPDVAPFRAHVAAMYDEAQRDPELAPLVEAIREVR